MRSIEGFILPALFSTLLHAVVLALVFANWQPERELVKPVPRHVKARIVTLEERAAKPQPKPAAPALTAAPKPSPEPEPAKPTPAPQPKPAPKPQPKQEPPKPDPKVQEEARKREEQRRADEQRRNAEERRRQRERELAAALATEEQVMQAESELEFAQTYADAIMTTVEDNWSRPPSARRGMHVRLRLQLIPSGEVVAVSVLSSSGNDAFDRSAIDAVRRAGRFPEVANAPPQVFERHLRSLILDFHPEDLRL